MYSFNKNTGDYDMENLKDLFEDIRKNAMDSGYDLIVKYGMIGMKKELGSKNPVQLANKLMAYFIKYEEYEKCAKLKGLIDEYNKKSKIKKDKNYENKHLDKKGRSTKR
jgi:hypothetical protein